MRASYVVPPAIALLSVLAIQSQTVQDEVVFHCGDAKTDCPGAEDGGFVLVSGSKEVSHTTSGKRIELGQVDASFTQLMAFRRGWAPVFLKPQWRRGKDTRDIVF